MQADDQVIYVVTGAVRSGTSMMMQMLEAGGLPVVFSPRQDKLHTHGKHPGYNPNPHGFYETVYASHNPRRQPDFNSFHGKAIKLFIGWLSHLPQNQKFKIIFMRRPVTEIMDSAQEFESKVEKAKTTMHTVELEERLASAVQAVLDNGHPTIFVEYAKVIADPAEQSEVIASFLGLPLDSEKMAAAVDQTLYHHNHG